MNSFNFDCSVMAGKINNAVSKLSTWLQIICMVTTKNPPVLTTHSTPFPEKVRGKGAVTASSMITLLNHSRSVNKLQKEPYLIYEK